MSDESNIPASLEEYKELSVEVQPKEQQQLPVAEGHETEVLPQQQEKGESGRKPSTTPKAIRLATISKLLEKQTTQMDKIGQMVQPLQKQLNQWRDELNSSNKCLPSLNNYKNKCRKLRRRVRR